MDKVDTKYLSRKLTKHEVFAYYFNNSPNKAYVYRIDNSTNKHEIHIKKGGNWHYWIGSLIPTNRNYFNSLRICGSAIGVKFY